MSRYKSIHRKIQFVRYTFADGSIAVFMGPPLPTSGGKITDVEFSQLMALPDDVVLAVAPNDFLSFVDTASLEPAMLPEGTILDPDPN
jgi:hypothetical protein